MCAENKKNTYGTKAFQKWPGFLSQNPVVFCPSRTAMEEQLRPTGYHNKATTNVHILTLFVCDSVLVVLWVF